MVTTQCEASTFDELQVPDVILIEPQRYCYFQVKDYPQIATQFMAAFPTETPANYLFHFINDADSARVSLLSAFREQELQSLPDDLTFINIFYQSYTTQYSTHANIYHRILDRLSTNIALPSFDYLRIEQATINLFDCYRHQEFDTDISYEFTNDLDIFIQSNGLSAIRAIYDLLKNQSNDHDIIAETLQALGRIEHEDTKEQRYQFLMDFIKDDSPIIRDAAVSGLSFLDDKRALPQLRILFETETVPILKNNINVAIRGFESY